MAKLGSTFKATDHDTDSQGEFENLPNGIYELEIEASEVKENSKGNGTLLKITATVLRPDELSGRKYFDNFNIEHANPKVQEIAQKDFAKLCRAIGVGEVDDSEELHFKSYIVKMGLGKPSKDGQYPARNEVKKYYYPDEGDMPEPAIDDNQPAAGVGRPANDNRPASNDNRPAPAAAASAAAGAKKRPWGK